MDEDEDDPVNWHLILLNLRDKARTFGKNLVDNYDHCEDSHKHNNIAACRVCSAEKFLIEIEEIVYG